MFSKLLFSLFFVILLPVCLFAQIDGLDIITDSSIGNDNDNDSNNNAVFVIRGIEFDITGKTRAFAVMQNGEFRIGEKIQGRENFDKYLALKIQLLNNQRVFDESGTKINYSFGSEEPDGGIPVRLFVSVRDSRNFVVLPYPQYSTNSGFKIDLKLRDYNFLGTMNQLRADLGYQFSKEEEHIFRFSIGAEIPFEAAGFLWNFNSQNSFVYRADKDSPLYFGNVTGLSLNLPWRRSTFVAGFNQHTFFNDNPETESIEVYGRDSLYNPYTATELFALWRLPTGIKIGEFGELVYNFRSAVMINYQSADMDMAMRSFYTLDNQLVFGRVNWVGNFRSGLLVSAGVIYDRYFNRPDAPDKFTLEGAVIFHEPLSNYFAISSRLKYRHFWQWSDLAGGWLPDWNAGELIRGVPDEHLRAFQMLSLNFDFTVRVLRFVPSDWFNNPSLRFFDVEIQASPFTDLALAQGPQSELYPDGIDFSFSNLLHTVGLEVIVFSSYFRSLHLRGSIGYNIEKVKNEGLELISGFFPKWHEIFIGLELGY